MPDKPEQFLDRLVHDLREPLRSVLLFSEILEEGTTGELKPESAEALAEIRNGAARLKTLIEGVSAYALTFHEDAGPPAPVSLQLALRSAMNNAGSALREAGAKVEWEPLPGVRANLEKIVRVFENLLGNAVKFRADEPLVVRVSPGEMAEGFQTISVQDNGIGIAAVDAKRIFEPFTRVHGRRYPGSGLGLTVCRRIVEGYGGRIWAEPVEPHGTRVSFTLPGDD